ncbi:MAG: hypothetical protein HYU41_21270 [Candidatus Rokubacteria bacterium]|nr:hypothetical protein [Candidatus Rokubacteria bacterium]
MTFIVRLSSDAAGRVTGIVERVRNGQKERFEGLEGLAPALARMARPEDFAPAVEGTRTEGELR